MAERTVAVRLAARVDAYVAAMKAAQASTTGFSRATERNLKSVGTQMQNIGRKMTTFVTLPIVAAGALAVKAAVDWDSAWAGVTKTVDGTASQMATLEQGLRDMTKEVSASHGEIAAVAEAAGALGVGVEDIEDFTRVMIDLGETTNLTSDQAATSIAQLMNVMGTAGGDVDNLGAALVALGNNGASTEDQIIQMAQRIAGAGAIVGLTEADVLGFANALASMGIEVEAGGSAFSRVITDMSKAVAQGGDDLDAFAEVAGVSASQFATAFREDPAQAIVSFIMGLQRIHAAGGDVFTVLDNLGLSDIRVSRALLSMATSGDLLTESLDMSAQAWGENTALADEAAKRYDTAAAQFEIVRNKIVDLFIDLGEMLLPIVSGVVDAIGSLAEGFQALPAPVQVAVGGFLALVAAVGPIMFLTGSVMKNLTSLVGLFGLTGAAATTAARALGLVGIALAGGIAAYGIFTAEQRQTESNTKAATAALDTQFNSLMMAAIAAAGASHEVDALAVANEALSLSISEGNQQLADALATLNVSAEQTLDVLALMDADAESMATTIDFLSRSFGLNAEQANFVATNWGLISNVFGPVSEQAIAAADAFGITEEQLVTLETALSSFFDAADETDIQQMARDFLDARVKASEYGKSLVLAAEDQAEQNRQTGDAIAVYRAYAAQVAVLSDEQLTAAGITAEMAAEIATVDAALAGATGSAGGFAEEMVSASDAMEHLQEIFDGMRAPNWPDMFPDASSDFRGFMADAQFMGEAIHGTVDPMLALMQAEDQLWSSTNALGDAFDDNSKTLVGNSDAAIANREVIFGMVGEILAVTDAQIGMNYTTDTVTRTVSHNRDALLDNAEAAGANRDEVEYLIDTLGLMPEDVATTVTLAGELYFLDKINEMLDDIGEIPESVETEMEAILMTEGAQAAADHLEAYVEGLNPTLDVSVNVRNPVITMSQNTSGNRGLVRASPFAEGGLVRGGSNTLGLLGDRSGSRGDEVILPLGNPGRMAALLGMSEVGPRVAAALGNLMPAPVFSTPSGSGGSSSGPAGNSWHIDNVNVSDPRQLPQLSHELERAVFLVGAGAR